jgi:hypothetical protein
MTIQRPSRIWQVDGWLPTSNPNVHALCVRDGTACLLAHWSARLCGACRNAACEMHEPGGSSGHVLLAHSAVRVVSVPHTRQPVQSVPDASTPLASLRRGTSQLFETERRLNAVLNNASVSIFLMDDT